VALSKLNNDSFDDTAVHGRRNLIINGAMQVAQRGTSFTDADTYSLDRWRLNQSSETMAVTQQSFTAGQTDVSRAEKYLRVVITTTGNNAGITQRIEGVEQLSGQTVTVSFYARGGQGGQGVPTTFRTYLNQNFGSGGSTAVNVQGSTNHTLTTSWQLFTANVTLGSTSGKTIGTSSYTELVFQQTTGEACDFDLTLCQLEVGDKATPFEHRSFGEELALCQRYFYGINANTLTPVSGALFGIPGNYYSSSQINFQITFPVTMRASPSLTDGVGSDYYRFYRNGSYDDLTKIDVDSINNGFAAVNNSTDASGTAGQAGTLQIRTTTGGYLNFDAEL